MNSMEHIDSELQTNNERLHTIKILIRPSLF